MECSNFFCIYQKDDKCMLDEISLDICGRCQECIYPNIPTYILEAEKEALRKKFDTEI